ncbi:type I-U CRISPR-associated protein Csb2 [Nannocystis sp. RBIL2]|uniref:type I-G CRISPR-associated protein Csb2 n=1 Tax=Nannocystis sp. RBIL2 TaxID=2996788 RepID=UPI0022706E2E|nr:type I-U CRISPR-associated protein Csb2 [Nannocystis sp. RBIL2]
MIAVAFELLAGRYHATGWDHHVNEGTVEWPPSPWRLLRAMLSAALREALPADRVRALLLRFAGLPHYHLPRAAASHLRHYMPLADDKTTKVFDAFYAFERPAELVVTWPEVHLDAPERELLAAILAAIPYLGRAESWSHARLCDPPSTSDVIARPAADEPSEHRARLLAPRPADEYRAWRDGYLAALDPKQRKRLSLPTDVWEALHQDTDALFKDGWSRPPGARWVDYTFDVDPLSSRRTAHRPATLATPAPDIARFVLDSAVHLRVEKTLWVAEKLRAALLSKLGNLAPGDAPSLIGHGDDAAPLTGHRHAYFLPEADARGFIDHVTVYAPGGFDPAAVRALQSLRELHGLGSHPTYPTLVALGQRDRLERLPALFGRSDTWETLTPFIPPRCPKLRRGELRDTPEQQLRWLCREVLGEEPLTVEMFSPEEARRRGLHHFRNARRRGAPVPGGAAAHGARFRFTAPIAGPIALGYGAHFGLGVFRPVVDKNF